MSSSRLKPMLVAPVRAALRITARLREYAVRLYAHASLASKLRQRLPSSVVVLGRITVHGTGNVLVGENALFYPDLHLETEEQASIVLEEGIVLSRGIHLVARADIHIGAGSMIGEYTSIRDANHTREAATSLRDSAHKAAPIWIGKQVWIGRGATVLGGVTIGDGATVGANAVVTRDVAAGDIVGGVPAISLKKTQRA